MKKPRKPPVIIPDSLTSVNEEKSKRDLDKLNEKFSRAVGQFDDITKANKERYKAERDLIDAAQPKRKRRDVGVAPAPEAGVKRVIPGKSGFRPGFRRKP